MDPSCLSSGKIFNLMQRFHLSLRVALFGLTPLLISAEAMAAPLLPADDQPCLKGEDDQACINAKAPEAASSAETLPSGSRINTLLNELRDYKLDVVAGFS